MPRVGDPILPREYPWDEWEHLLKKSPTKTLFFSSDDFAPLTLNAFRKRAQTAFRHLDVYVGLRGEEIMVTLNA